jgi:hypothetical protein
MRNLLTVEEAKGVCKDRNKWKEVISEYPKGKRDVMYVLCMLYNVFLHTISSLPMLKGSQFFTFILRKLVSNHF